MSKKNYQINVIDAEQIKKQNNQNLNNTNDENIQNHSQSISSNLTLNNSTTNNNQKPKELKTGLLIGGMVTFFLSLCFLAVTVYFIFQTYSTNNDAEKAITFILFILTFGWMSYIPGVICSIFSLCLNAFVIKSDSKIQKILGIILTLISVILIIAYLFIAIYIISLPNS